MAGQHIATRPLLYGVLDRLAAWPSRNIRITVLFCVIAIGGSFAAAGALQLRFETANATRQAAYFESRRAADLSAVVAASLERAEEEGRRFAAGTLTSLPPGVHGMAISDINGTPGAVLGEALPMESLVAQVHDTPVVTGGKDRTIIAFREGETIIAVSFYPLLPGSPLDNAGIFGAGGAVLAGHAISGETVGANVPGWPLRVEVLAQDPEAVNAWYASVPLYIFVIAGPALVGAWLAAVFVREFERRAKAAEAIRSLRTTRPAEAKLLVRLANAERAAVESARSKNEFIAHMSHELRTPLNAIIGFSEVIERGYYGPVGHKKYVEYAHDIGMAGRHLHDKVGDILEFANLEAGRYPLQLAVFDAAELVGTVVSDNAGRAFSRRISLTMLPSGPAMVTADRAAVQRITANLLSNALLYTPEGGKVHVVLREDAGAVSIAIIDTGAGFSQAERETVGTAFRRFERVGVSTGTGLGLAIAVSLARRMGGALRLETAPGGGTSAELRLRRA
ncbi:signal transduction histidine kinase [Rhizomicrobium palustre]|uniref:histidine kinase n=1 Tax=Rhizomicrobium palustre TaxID=189966 RepID=A0A846N120_9PROT|nr:HAMP domain-containing sensor histidine kinase [Rhizomicrobium palustre]NIK88857.1 signal transduction histidine kinase [Rhizomicrobium palustre]